MNNLHDQLYLHRRSLTFELQQLRGFIDETITTHLADEDGFEALSIGSKGIKTYSLLQSTLRTFQYFRPIQILTQQMNITLA
jgi:hypothetical protein